MKTENEIAYDIMGMAIEFTGLWDRDFSNQFMKIAWRMREE